ncbi:MAG: hypothetical protein V8T10_00125 [Merdibacter sp.]
MWKTKRREEMYALDGRWIECRANVRAMDERPSGTAQGRAG